MLKGDFTFKDIRDDWDSQGFEEDSYRGYEIWSGGNYYALFEDSGIAISSSSEDVFKDIIKNLGRDSGSLSNSQNSDMKRILDKLGAAPVVIAGVIECGDAVNGCQGFGVASYTAYNSDRGEVSANLAVLFSSEQRAEQAVDDYDAVSEFMQNTLDATGTAELVGDIILDGEFVLGNRIIKYVKEE